MRLSNLKINNYRCIREADFSINNYTALIGPNGSGKSSLLYALGWFYDKIDITSTDLCRNSQPSDLVSVTVEFTDLSPTERQALGRFGLYSNLSLTKTFDPGTSLVTRSGVSHSGPGFESFYKATYISDKRTAYNDLRSNGLALPDLGVRPTEPDMRHALENWERDPNHSSLLISCPGDDASELFGNSRIFFGLSEFILVPASTNLSQEIGIAGKGSALSSLIGRISSAAAGKAKQQWIEKHQDIIDQLGEDMTSAISDATGVHIASVNEYFKSYVSTGSIEFETSTPAWELKGEPTIRTNVTLGTNTLDVSSQGHGVQRAVMMAVMQAISKSDTTEPSIILAIEEPEIYQHPIRARSFARTLSSASDTESTQVIIATHSPYFVTPDRIESIHRMTIVQGCSQISSISLGTIQYVLNMGATQLRKRIQQEIPKSFSECLFADCVVLVEGLTDRVVVEEVADLLGHPLDSHGIVVFDCGGKQNLVFYHSFLKAIGIASYVIVDGDVPKPSADHLAKTNDVLSVVKPVDHLGNSISFVSPYSSFAATNVTVFHDDLEDELSRWLDFNTSLGHKPDLKDAYQYRMACRMINPSTIPALLNDLVSAIVKYATLSGSAYKSQALHSTTATSSIN